MIHHIIIALSGNVFYVAFDLDRWVLAVVNLNHVTIQILKLKWLTQLKFHIFI